MPKRDASNFECNFFKFTVLLYIGVVVYVYRYGLGAVVPQWLYDPAGAVA